MYIVIIGWRRIRVERIQNILTIKQTLNFQFKHLHKLICQGLKNNCYLVLSYLTDVTVSQKTLRHTIVNTNT